MTLMSWAAASSFGGTPSPAATVVVFGVGSGFIASATNQGKQRHRHSAPPVGRTGFAADRSLEAVGGVPIWGGAQATGASRERPTRPSQ